MEFRGQRFAVDFSDDEADRDRPEHGEPSKLVATAVPSLSSGFIGDIKEREVRAPSAPKLKATPNGFPEHKKRTRISAFKQQRAAASRPAPDSGNAYALPTGSATSTNPSGLTQQGDSFSETERRRIDEENKRRLADMSLEEIDDERRELMASLDPSLIARLLKRADLDQGRGDTGTGLPTKEEPPTRDVQESEARSRQKEEDSSEDAQPVQAGVPAPRPSGKRFTASKSVNWEDEQEPSRPIDLQPASQPPSNNPVSLPQEPSVHFPSAPTAPDLDPSDPSFLSSLHEKYFPNLPSDPSKLAWMAPLPTTGSAADQDSPYYPDHAALAASSLRFDFRGGILPPRIARAMPTTKGLHHHGEAPESAGYTVPELARLARSAFPAQRCIAFQTLGRLLYRLGRGEWGGEDGEITKGLWRCVEEGGVIRTLEDAAAVEGGHQGSKVYAVEAVWLWQKGGGKVWKAS